VSHETVLPSRITIDNPLDAHSPMSIAQDQNNDQKTAWIALEDEPRPPDQQHGRATKGEPP